MEDIIKRTVQIVAPFEITDQLQNEPNETLKGTVNIKARRNAAKNADTISTVNQ